MDAKYKKKIDENISKIKKLEEENNELKNKV
jgi:hypothetical protein